MRFFVTGAAGFLGSNLVDRLLSGGHSVVGYDNLVTGRLEFLEQAASHPHFKLIRGDLLDQEALNQAIGGAEFVFHLAANADVRFGTEHPRKDLEQNTIATANVLEAMRACGIRRLAFTSTGSIYGEPDVFPTPETAPFPTQTSLYGAAKLAAEGLIQAYCEGFGFQAQIFRLVSILGERYTHGHVYDFYQQLCAHPGQLHVLGDGRQRKSYLYVQDCVSAMLLAMEKAGNKAEMFNLGTDEYCAVTDSIRWICETLSVQPRLTFGGGPRGWTGDSPFIFLDCARIRALGWRPQVPIREGVVRTVRYLQANPGVLARP